jgi:hypothetical protein
MKWTWMLVWFLLILSAKAGLTPETLTAEYNREDADTYINTNTYLSGTTLLFTNCNALVSTGVTQDLTGVSVLLRVGNETTNTLYAATVDSGTGLFWALLYIPTHSQLDVPVQLDATVRIQCTLTNATTTFTYRGSKLLTTRAGLTY